MLDNEEMPEGAIDITPIDSVSPVYRMPDAPIEPMPELPSPDELFAAQAELRTAGIIKLMALGLTEDEARSFAGS